jgi:hypothetical protein
VLLGAKIRELIFLRIMAISHLMTGQLIGDASAASLLAAPKETTLCHVAVQQRIQNGVLSFSFLHDVSVIN